MEVEIQIAPENFRDPPPPPPHTHWSVLHPVVKPQPLLCPQSSPSGNRSDWSRTLPLTLVDLSGHFKVLASSRGFFLSQVNTRFVVYTFVTLSNFIIVRDKLRGRSVKNVSSPVNTVKQNALQSDLISRIKGKK